MRSTSFENMTTTLSVLVLWGSVVLNVGLLLYNQTYGKLKVEEAA